MITPAIQHFLKLANESHEVANGLIDRVIPAFLPITLASRGPKPAR